MGGWKVGARKGQAAVVLLRKVLWCYIMSRQLGGTALIAARLLRQQMSSRNSTRRGASSGEWGGESGSFPPIRARGEEGGLLTPAADLRVMPRESCMFCLHKGPVGLVRLHSIPSRPALLRWALSHTWTMLPPANHLLPAACAAECRAGGGDVHVLLRSAAAVFSGRSLSLHPRRPARLPGAVPAVLV